MTNQVKRGRVGKLSLLIDPLLLEGGRRVNQIADLIVAQTNGEYTKGQVVNNIRSRMNVLVKRGYRLERAADRADAKRLFLVRLVAPVAAEAVTPASV